MKNLFIRGLLMVMITGLFYSCKKDLEQKTLIPPSGVQGFSANSTNIVLTEATDNTSVVTFQFQNPDYGVGVVKTYTLQFDVPADTAGANAWGKAAEVTISSADGTKKSFLGKDLNALLLNQLKLRAGTPSAVAVRLKADVNQPTGLPTSIPSLYSTIVMTVTPYEQIIIYPALMVKGGNSWKTPAERTDGFLLTSQNFNNKYEGYLYLPNADNWGGDAFTLVSTVNGKVYGWGTNATTLAEGSGNLWLTPAPNYMKVNADLDAMTISYTPVNFFITGDDNGWSTSATPMTYDAATRKWVANNVALTAGKSFEFTANGSYDISYKLNSEGKLVFAGDPVWGGINIPVAKTGVYKITLDMSQGAGKYTYSIE